MISVLAMELKNIAYDFIRTIRNAVWMLLADFVSYGDT
jgi:hypothetical protein